MSILSEISEAASSFLYTVTVENGYNLAAAVPSLRPTKAYKYPDLKTPEGRAVCMLPEDDELQQRVNTVFEDYSCSPHNLVSEGKAEEIGSNGTPLIFKHPSFPEHILKTPAKLCTSTKEVNGNRCYRLDGYTTITIDRVPMAYGLRDIIEKEHLDHLYVPKKCLAKIPYESSALQDKNYVVLAEKLDLTDPKETRARMDQMDPEQLKIMLRQLYTLMIKSGYVDGHGHNFAFIKSGPNAGKLAVYDTEALATFDSRNTQIEERELYSLDRDNHLSCASFAISESVAPKRGLPIDSTIIGPIAREFKCRSWMERGSNLIKGIFLVSSAILVPIAAAVIQANLSK